jgi:hypothetical protein
MASASAGGGQIAVTLGSLDHSSPGRDHSVSACEDDHIVAVGDHVRVTLAEASGELCRLVGDPVSRPL